MKRLSTLVVGALLSGGMIYAQDDKPQNIGPGVTAPHVTQKAEPEYTETARAAKINGSVMLKLVVGTDGLAHDINVVRSLEPSLDVKAVEAVQKWHFAPATKDGKPVAVFANIEVNFRML